MQTINDLLKKEDTVLIDVRNDWEYLEGHLKGSIHIPLHEIPANIGKIKQLKGPFVLYCRSGNRSGVGVKMLRHAGIDNVYDGGGLSEMQEKVSLSK